MAGAAGHVVSRASSRSSRGPRAAEAGRQPGDGIVEVDGEPVEDVGDVLAIVLERSPGDELELGVLRGEGASRRAGRARRAARRHAVSHM